MAAARGIWGGQRKGAGRKPGWKSGPCKVVKLPAALVDQVLHYARQLDDGALEHVPPAAPAGPAAEDRWAQVSKLIDEKAELQRKLAHMTELLAGERKKLEQERARGRELQRRQDDARSVLLAALDEHRRGVRKGIRPVDVRSALLALGLDTDAPQT